MYLNQIKRYVPLEVPEDVGLQHLLCVKKDDMGAPNKGRQNMTAPRWWAAV